jgi:membrane protease YdiL (CAAX protease family)
VTAAAELSKGNAMHHRDGSTHVWDGYRALSFAFSVCAVYWAVCIAGSFFADRTITISPPWVEFTIENRFINRVITVSSPNVQFTIHTKVILLMAASFLPALYCFCVYPECRASLKKVNANWKVYFVAIATGLSLPFLSYPGTHYLAFPWGRQAAVHLARLFAVNLFLSPMWEEIVWRGCFLKKIRSFSSASSGILLMSVGWTIWGGIHCVSL